MLSTKSDLICKRLRNEGDKLLALFEALTPGRWQSVIYTDGMNWSIKDVLAHQISAERKFQFYGQDILKGGEGAPEGFVVNEFNNAEVAGLGDRSPSYWLICDQCGKRRSIWPGQSPKPSLPDVDGIRSSA